MLKKIQAVRKSFIRFKKQCEARLAVGLTLSQLVANSSTQHSLLWRTVTAALYLRDLVGTQMGRWILTEGNERCVCLACCRGLRQWVNSCDQHPDGTSGHLPNAAVASTEEVVERRAPHQRERFSQSCTVCILIMCPPFCLLCNK